jgi:hypothetical protein
MHSAGKQIVAVYLKPHVLIAAQGGGGMKIQHLLKAIVIGVSVLFTSGLWAANLHIAEGSNGVVMSGDCNFTCNDWGGLISSTSPNFETASITAYLYSPNMTAAAAASVAILDPNGHFSDVFIEQYSGGVNGIFSASFCSVDDTGNPNVSCFPPIAGTSIQYVYEDAFGNFTLPSIDPNMSIQGVSPVPEPETYALMLAGLGLLGLGARRRKQAAK